MPALIAKTYKNKDGKSITKRYVVENQCINGETKRIYLENLGECLLKDAKKALAKYQNSVTSTALFKEIVDQFFIVYKKKIDVEIRPKTYQTDHECKSKILEYLGGYPLNKIKYDNIENFKSFLLVEKKLANRTVNIHLTTLKKIFNYCKDREIISDIPPMRKLPQHYIDKEIHFLSKDQVVKLLTFANDNQQFYIIFMLHTGMRPNEFERLTWEEINLKEKYIDINSANPLKKGRRLPINNSLIAILKGRDITSAPCPYKPRTIQDSLHYLGLKTQIHITPYTLRKTFGSWLVQSGVDILTVSELMGHRSIETTRKHYARLLHDNLAKAIENLQINFTVHS